MNEFFALSDARRRLVFEQGAVRWSLPETAIAIAFLVMNLETLLQIILCLFATL